MTFLQKAVKQKVAAAKQLIYGNSRKNQQNNNQYQSYYNARNKSDYKRMGARRLSVLIYKIEYINPAVGNKKLNKANQKLFLLLRP